MRLFAATILALSVLGGTPALAQDTADRPFEGVTVTAIAGIDLGSEVARNENHLVYGGQLGYDWQHGRTVLGIEAEVTGMADTEQCYEHLTSPTSPDRSCGKAGRDIYVGGRFGRAITATTLLYVKAGYTNVRDEYRYTDGDTGAGDQSGGYSRGGYRVGLGIEKAIGENLRLKAEYRYSNYDFGYSRHQAVAGIGFHF